MPVQSPVKKSRPVVFHEKRGAGAKIILLIHGFGLNRKTWYDIADTLCEHAAVFMIDLIGSGNSPAPQQWPYSFESQADAVFDFIRGHAFSNITLVGHSYGGGVCLMLMQKLAAKGQNHLVDRLVLIAPAAYPQPLPFFMAIPRVPFLGAWLLKWVPSEFQIEMTLKRVLYHRWIITPERIARYSENVVRPAYRSALIKTAKNALAHENEPLSEKIRTIQTRVLLIYGDHDTVILKKNLEKLARTLPNVETRVIPGCGHIPQEEYPEKIAGLIVRFFLTP